jgi:hypothetical protein
MHKYRWDSVLMVAVGGNAGGPEHETGGRSGPRGGAGSVPDSRSRGTTLPVPVGRSARPAPSLRVIPGRSSASLGRRDALPYRCVGAARCRSSATEPTKMMRAKLNHWMA